MSKGGILEVVLVGAQGIKHVNLVGKILAACFNVVQNVDFKCNNFMYFDY